MANNIVKLADGTILVDLSSDTVTSSKMLKGAKAHNSAGEVINGNIDNNGTISGNIDGIESEEYSVPSGFTSGGKVSLTSDINNALGEIISEQNNSGTNKQKLKIINDETQLQEDLIRQIKNILSGKDAGIDSSNMLFESGIISFHTDTGLQAMAIPVSDTSYQNYMLFARATKSWKKVGGVWVEQANIDFSGTTHNRFIVSQLIATYPAQQTSWITVADGETTPIIDTFGIETHLMSSYREQNNAFINLCPYLTGVANPSIDIDNNSVVFPTQRDVCNNTVGMTYEYAIVGWNNG